MNSTPGYTYHTLMRENPKDPAGRAMAVASMWLPFGFVSNEVERTALLAAYGADYFAPILEENVDRTAVNRRRDFSRQVVENVRQNCPGLEPYSDDQVYNAYVNYTMSVDHGDETKVINWIEEE